MSKKQEKYTWIVGIDEAGRGPLAGPVTVGLVKIKSTFDWNQIPGVNDSKKLSEKNRDIIYKIAQELHVKGMIEYSVKSVSAKSIDAKGIAPAIRRAIASGLEDLQISPEETRILLDGSLKAPEMYQQETIIQGDAKEPVIGLASILAKVTRDSYMKAVAKKYPEYGLEQHKGYGTKTHREAIAQHGFTEIHRQTYCKNIQLL